MKTFRITNLAVPCLKLAAWIAFLTAAHLVSPTTAISQGTAFTYQGVLNVTGAPANGTYDLTFALYISSSGPGQVGNSLTNVATPVNNGLFIALLDFGNN